MKIKRHIQSDAQSDALRRQLTTVLDAQNEKGRVCGPQCTFRCPSCGSTACRCNCSQDCPNVANALSSDPENYPLEPGIAPLVFEMKRLGVFDSCWSCEGHKGHDGSLWKVPRVWFYCEDMVHLRLLADCLKQLSIKKQLSVPWQVCLTHSDEDNPGTTFSLEPSPDHVKDADLQALQHDIMVIAGKLNDLFVTGARTLRHRLADMMRRVGLERGAKRPRSA